MNQKIQTQILEEYDLKENQESLVKGLIGENYFKRFRDLFSYLEAID